MYAKRLAMLVVAIGLIAGSLVGCGGTTTAAPPADNNNNNGGDGGQDVTRGAYVGYQNCLGCHEDLTNHWEATKHGNAWATLVAINQQGNTRCQRCHVTGMGEEGGFVSPDATPSLVDVQCEACHGPGIAHVANPRQDNIVKQPDSAVCGACHQGTHHPQWEEFQQSQHSVSTRNARSDDCVPCHTGDGFVYSLYEPTRPQPAPRQLGSPAEHSVGCWACHNPHENVAGTTNQLRLPVNDLCKECHTFREERSTPGTRVHRPQADVLNGTAGYVWAGTRFQPLTLPAARVTHAQVTDGDCAVCHVFRYESEGDAGGTIHNTGHHFRPNLQSCNIAGCHSGLVRQSDTPTLITDGTITEGASEAVIALYNDTQSALSGRYLTLRARLNAVNRNNLTVAQAGAYDTAKFNLDVILEDSSGGIHNPLYVTMMMDEVERILNNVLPAP